MRGAALALAVALPLLVAGCATEPSGPQTHLHIDFAGAHENVDADLAFDAAARHANPFYVQHNASHAPFYTAFDQIVQWSNGGGMYVRPAYDDSFHDFYLASIGGEPPTGAPRYWNLAVNGIDATVGMGATPVHEGDTVTWTLKAF